MSGMRTAGELGVERARTNRSEVASHATHGCARDMHV